MLSDIEEGSNLMLMRLTPVAIPVLLQTIIERRHRGR